ncbi:MAG: ribose-phosphate pyrophosphokinase [Candidatus Omnitrophica bacterium]|nr:ribose-phosphate pyrophosphokinase [Candidatus Omnitrophota bacterium]
MKDELVVFSGNSNPSLARTICKYLKIPLGDALISKFSEGEIRVKINQDVRGRDVFVIQSTCPPVNDNLVELLIMIDALKRASSRRLTAVLPFYGYARQDRKDQPRVPITAKLVANLITTSGADRLLTIDLHAGQIQGFFDIPVDHLLAAPVLIEYYKKLKLRDLVVASPDVGGIKMARAFSKKLNADLAIVDKRRLDYQNSEVMNILGDVKGKNIIIVDDQVTTAGSITEASYALKEAGARDIYAGITHGIFSGPAIARIEKSPLKEVVVTDTIPLSKEKQNKKIRILSISRLLGEAIKRIHNEESVSSLFV